MVPTENTLSAFAAALAADSRYLETDVRATSDGIAVLLHDPHFVTRDGVRHRINRVASTDLPSLLLPCGEQIPTLSAALEHFPELRFNLDVKSADAAGAVVTAVENASASSRVLVTSFSRARRRKALAQLPNAFSGAGQADALVIIFAALTKQHWLLHRLSRNIHAVQLPCTGLAHRILTSTVISRIQQARIEVHVWTPNTREDIDEWLGRGVDGIVTDRTDIAREAVRSPEISAS